MSKYNPVKKQILAAILEANHVMLVAHNKPDGDATGACLAMAHFLESMDKKFDCFCSGELNSTFYYLPKYEFIKNDPEKILNTKFDLLIVLDSGDLRYAGIAQHLKQLTHDYQIINIDHHPTNENYGHHNLVVKDASSTCEIIHYLIEDQINIDKNIATCLLTGIITDTGSFSNLATTSSAIAAASKLLMAGADMKNITRHTLQHRPVNTLKLWGKALERLYRDPKTGFIITVITYEDMQECFADNDACEGVANFLNSLKEADQSTVMVLTERLPGEIKASLRTTSPLLDVSAFAKLLGGGGHKKAAGFSLKGSLTKTQYGWKIIPNN